MQSSETAFLELKVGPKKRAEKKILGSPGEGSGEPSHGLTSDRQAGAFFAFVGTPAGFFFARPRKKAGPRAGGPMIPTPTVHPPIDRPACGPQSVMTTGCRRQIGGKRDGSADRKSRGTSFGWAAVEAQRPRFFLCRFCPRPPPIPSPHPAGRHPPLAAVTRAAANGGRNWGLHPPAAPGGRVPARANTRAPPRTANRRPRPSFSPAPHTTRTALSNTHQCDAQPPAL